MHVQIYRDFFAMNSKLSFVFVIILVSSIEWMSVSSNSFKSVLEPVFSSLPFNDGYKNLLYQVENSLDRVKRQQSVTVSQVPSEDEQFTAQPWECGINSKSEGLVKSVDNFSPNHDWPWIAMLLNRHELPPNFCGGVLLNRNYVLTAAHCIKSKNADDFYVRLGEYNLLIEFETRHMDIDVAEIKVHKDYSAANYEHDIALLRLREPISYTNTILPICLPTSNTKLQTNQTAIVAGWGAIFYGGMSSDELLEVSVPLWDLEACQSSYAQTIFETNICAAGYEGQRDSCVGDSGGPLVIQQANGRWTNIGIVSWGISCGIRNHPGIYTKVESYLDWIKNNTRDAAL